MEKNRICFACGEHYEWCNTCHDFNPTDSWKYLYDTEDCLAMSKIWYAYKGDEITKAEAKMLAEKHPETLEKVLKNNSVLAKAFQDICKEEKQEKVEQTVENKVDDADKPEEDVVKPERKSSENKINRNKK